MKPVNETALNALSVAANQNSAAVDADFLWQATVQAVVTDAASAGTVKIQGSNDPVNVQLNQVPTNWANIANSTVTIAGAGVYLVPLTQLCHKSIRVTYTSTVAGVQTVALIADVSGSLNSKYFLLNSGNDTNKYYVWFNINSAGVDPLIAGRTGVPITGTTNASAATLGTAVASAVAALNSTNDFTTSGTSTATITNKVAGGFARMVDGTAATGFTFGLTTPSGLITAILQAQGV